MSRQAADTDDHWALRAADRALLGNKTAATRLGFAVLCRSAWKIGSSAGSVQVVVMLHGSGVP